MTNLDYLKTKDVLYLKGKCWTEHNMTNSYIIEQFFILYNICWTKDYFNILDDLYLSQKVVLWFNK